MSVELNQYEEKMNKSLDSLANEYTTIRAGRANPHILDKITVEYYGTPTNLQSVANISVSEERRKDLVKDVKKKGEDAKVAIRNIRRDANDMVKKQQKANEISEDEQKNAEDSIQKMTDEFVAKIDKMIEAKSKEIMTV